MEYQPGDQIGSLTVERELGRGAFGTVYLARDTLIRRHVALKAIHAPKDRVSDAVRERMLTEARLISRLNNPHVVTLYRLHEVPDGGLLQEMELVSGGTLEDQLAAGDRTPVSESVRVFRSVCIALRAAHEARIVHGDIKPANVLFAEDHTPKLADFGLARVLEGTDEVVTLGGAVAGSPLYMAPEALSGRETGRASDLWSAAVLLYQSLTGRLPFPATTLGELLQRVTSADPDPMDESIPGPVAALVERCLAKAPSDRPASMDEVLDKLDRLAGELPALALAPVARRRPTNVLEDPSSFIGRESEIDDLVEILRHGGSQVLTLLGPGGVGKTRISRELCRTLAEEYPGGCWFADLAEIRDADGIALTIARILNVPLGGDKDPIETLGSVLELRPRMILVLDNFEQVLPHAEATIGRWREQAPEVGFLVTSRARLGLEDEVTFELAPLATEGDGDAFRLFVRRATEADPAFALDPEDRTFVQEIVTGLDGMPLAIELAAARVRIMNPEKIASNLGRKFQLLRSSRRDLTPRQKTLRGAISWSFDLLDEWEREAFLQVCSFRGGFDLAAAERVFDLSAFPDAPGLLAAIQDLRDKSLLTARDEGRGLRLGMFRAIREYGESQWKTRPEEFGGVADRHLGYFREFAEEWNGKIPGFRDEEAMDRIVTELGNLEAAREWARSAGDEASLVAITLATAETLRVRASPARLAAMLEETLAAMENRESAEAGRLLAWLSVAERLSGEWDRAVASAESAVTLLRAAGDADGLAIALVEQGEILRNRGRLDEAKAAFEEGSEVGADCGSRRAVALGTGGRGMVLGQQGDYDSAFQCFWEAETIARTMGDRQTVALNCGNLGVVYESRGETEAALGFHRKAEDISRQLGNRIRVAVALGAQANVHSQCGRFDDAVACYREAEEIARELGAKQRIAQIVGNRGAMHAMRKELDEALECFDEAESLARELGDRGRQAVSLGQKGRVLEKQKQKEKAVECFRRAEEISREIGDLVIAARNLCDRACLLSSVRRFDEAHRLLAEGVRMYDDMHANGSVWYLSFKSELVSLTARRGEYESAKALVAECFELAGQLGVDLDHADPALKRSYRKLLLLRRVLAGA